jgi:N-acetylglutamate synthase-like GNAT family acetyltransferase
MDTGYKPFKIVKAQCSFDTQHLVQNNTFTTIARLNIRELGQELPNIGRVTFTHDKTKKCGYITNLDVNEICRKRGCGSLLLTYACEELQKFGCTTIRLFATPPEQKNISRLVTFYTRFGFQLDTPCEDVSSCIGCYMHKNVHTPEYEQQIALLYKELPFPYTEE